MSKDLHSKLKGLIWIAVIATLGGISVLGFAFGVHKIPRSTENRYGEMLTQFPRSMLCDNPDSVRALNHLVERIYPQDTEDRPFPVSIQILRGGPVNAFASLGTRIFVYEGLIKKAESPEELAGVIAHEMGHVTERHVLQGFAFKLFMLPLWGTLSGAQIPVSPRVLNALAQMKFSREQEHEADLDGLERLKKAEVDTMGLSRFFERLKDSGISPEILSDHPSPENRAKFAKFYSVEHPRPVLTDEEWKTLRDICRL